VRIVRDPAAAEELTVETFWRIYRSHARFDPQRSFGAWARRIASNVALDYLKTIRRGWKHQAPLKAESVAAPAAPDPAAERETRENVRRCLRALPAKLQIVATLALIEELSHEEVAAALGLSPGAVRVRLHRAVRRLRDLLEKEGVTP
jgi:RNA polymerase sigma-70 factor (ECF subfamily)